MTPERLAAVRRTYEMARARRALWDTVPLAAMAIFVAWPLGRTGPAGAFGLLFAVAWGVSFRGGSPGRVIGPAAWLAWLPPFAALMLRHCDPSVCVRPGFEAVAVVAAAVGLACAGVARAARARQAGVLGWATACGVVVAASTLGCACIGVSSALALAGISVASASLTWPLLHGHRSQA